MAASCILIYNSSQFETLVLILTQLPYIAYALSRSLLIAMWISIGLLAAFICHSVAETVTYNWDITWVNAAPDGFSRPIIGK